MDRTPRSWRTARARLLGGLAVSFLLPAGALWADADTLPPTTDVVSAAAAPAPLGPLTVADCLRIADEQQPALAAHRASLAAAQTQYQGLKRLHPPPFVARDLPIRRQQACMGVTIAKAGLDQAWWETAYAVERTYYSVLYARQQQQVADDLVAALKFYHERVADLVKKGESRDYTTSTVDKIGLYLALAQTRQAEASRGMERALAALREAMGVAAGTPLTLAENKLPEPKVEVSRDQIVNLAVANRGELVQAETAERVTALEVDAQGKSLRPTMRTFAAVVDVHARPVPQGLANTEYRPGAVSLEMPTLMAGPRSARIERAENLSARATAVVDKTRNLVALDAEDAFLKWEDAVKKLPTAKAGAEGGLRLSKNTREDFTAGQRVKIEDILTNEVLAAQARSGYNETLYQLVIGLAGLQRVTAGGFDPGFAPK